MICVYECTITIQIHILWAVGVMVHGVLKALRTFSQVATRLTIRGNASKSVVTADLYSSLANY